MPVRLSAGTPNIKNRGVYERGAGDPPDWRIGCIFTSSKDRGKGVATAAVAAALAEIKRAVGGVVEAYPEQTEERPPPRRAYLHTAPEELYARCGFTRVRKIAKWRWVMRVKILSRRAAVFAAWRLRRMDQNWLLCALRTIHGARLRVERIRRSAGFARPALVHDA